MAIRELSKSEYAIFRSTRLNLLFDYLQSIEGYRNDVLKFTNKTDRKELRKALMTLFIEKGDNYDEAYSTTELHL